MDTAGNARRYIILAAGLLALTALSTAWTMPLIDPDEGYYPATAAESLDAGAGWDPRFNDAPRWDKPILTYALIEGSFSIFGRTVPAARLPSVLEGALLILIVGFVVNRVVGASAAGWTAFVLCSTIGVQVFARVAHPEIGVVLMITTTELIGVLWLLEPRDSRKTRLAALAGVATGLGVLFKGPVAIALPVLALGTTAPLLFGYPLPSSRTLRDLVAYGLTALAIALPWYVAMTWRHGWPFIEEAIWRHNFARFAGTAFGHRSPVWFFVAPTLVAMLPWTAFLPAALRRTTRTRREPTEILRLVMTVAALTAFAFYSMSRSKLPHYALAFVPPLGVVIGLHLSEMRQAGELSGSRRNTVILLGLLAAALAIAPSFVDRVVNARHILVGIEVSGPQARNLFARALWPGAGALALTAAAMQWKWRASWRLLVLAGATVPTIVIFSAQPLLTMAFPFARFARCLRSSDLPVLIVGPRTPSSTFYARRAVRHLSEGEAEQHEWPVDDALIVASTAWLRKRERENHDSLQALQSAGGMTLARWRSPDARGRRAVNDAGSACRVR